MQKKTILLAVILILLINTISHAQSKTDSLNTLLQTAEGEQKGEILFELGKEYQLLGKFVKALESYENAIKVLPEGKTKSNVMFKISEINRYFKDYDNALEYTLNGFEIRETMNDSAGIIAGYNNIANIYSDKGQLTEAKNYYEKALNFTIKYKNKKTQATILLNLAGLNINLKNFEIAIEQATKSFNISEELENYTNMMAALINKGLVYYHTKEYNNSLEAYNQAYKICEENNLKYYSGLVLRNMALTYLAMKNYVQAEKKPNKVYQYQKN